MYVAINIKHLPQVFSGCQPGSVCKGRTVRLICWVCGRTSVSLICWALWSQDRQSDMLGFVVVRL